MISLGADGSNSHSFSVSIGSSGESVRSLHSIDLVLYRRLYSNIGGNARDGDEESLVQDVSVSFELYFVYPESGSLTYFKPILQC